MPAASTCRATQSPPAKRASGQRAATTSETRTGEARADGQKFVDGRRAVGAAAASDALGRTLSAAVQRDPDRPARAAACAACRLISDGKAADAGPGSGEEDPTEELEGHHGSALGRLLARAVLRRARGATDRPLLQRMTITQHSLTTGNCGARNVQWVFALSNPAPEDGYIVQHIRSKADVQPCVAPGAKKRKRAKATSQEFWEAWLVKQGDTVDWTTTRDAWTDGSVRPASPNTQGEQVSKGTLKFFKATTTGDLGDFGQPSGDPKSAWGPGRVATSGALPSTPKKPSWWSKKPVEGPIKREAKSTWSCCDPDPVNHTSVVTVVPP